MGGGEHHHTVLARRSAAILLVCAVAIGFLLTLPPETAKRVSAEGALIENVSAVLLGMSLLACVSQLARQLSLPWLSASMVGLMLLLRELDFHRQFTARSIDSTGFYLSPVIPLETKLTVLVLALPFLLASLHLLWLGLRHLRAAVLARQPWVGYAALGLAMIGIARYAEKSGRDPTDVIEEVAEVAFAAFALLAVRSFTESRPAARRTRFRDR